ncbi:MAG TPA: hypothetical protein VFE48_10730 [Methylomirabilota bacterium]|nr:hypothetical protein [Methylomirabilota bacterium]
MTRSARLAATAIVGMLLVGITSGCTTSLAGPPEIRQAWAERDAERDRECRRGNGVLVAGSCLPCP